MITEQIVAEPPSPDRSEPAADTDLSSTVTEYAERARTAIKQRPVVAVLAAVGVGYVVARLVSRGAR